MPVFAYRGVTAGGSDARGVVDADSTRGAWQLLRTRGIYPTTIAAEVPAHGRAPAGADLIALTRRLAHLLAAGLPLTEALAAAAETFAGPAAETLTRIAGRVREGGTFADALDDADARFPSVYLAGVRAGERRGDLAGALARAADHLETALARRRRVTAALTYPAVVAATTAAVVVFLLVWVLPQVRVLVADAGGPPPWPTRIALGAGEFLAAAWWLLVAAAGIGAFAAWHAIRRRHATAWLARAAHLPVAGPLLRDAAAARAAHALGTLLDAGTPLDAALPLAGDAAGPLFAPAFTDVAARVRDGRALSAAFAASEMLPPLLTRLAATGERAGTLGASLTHAAAVLDDDVARRLERLVAWLEPALVLGTGGLVLAVVAAVLVPILGLDPTGAR